MAVVDEIERHTARKISVAATYVALRRLEKKGLVTGHQADPTPERGGRAKRLLEVTPLGMERLRESASAIFRIWDGLDPSLHQVSTSD